MPLPGSTGLFVWGEALNVSECGGNKEALISQGLMLEARLNRMTDRAEWAVRQPDPVSAYLSGRVETSMDLLDP